MTGLGFGRQDALKINDKQFHKVISYSVPDDPLFRDVDTHDHTAGIFLEESAYAKTILYYDSH